MFQKLIKKDSTPNSAIHPQLAEVVVFLHFKDKITSDSLNKMMLKSKIKSERVLQLLDELN